MSPNSRTNVNISSSRWSRTFFETQALPRNLRVPRFMIPLFASIARFNPSISCQRRYLDMRSGSISKRAPRSRVTARGQGIPTRPIGRNGSSHTIFSSLPSNLNRESEPEESTTPTLTFNNEVSENLQLASDAPESVVVNAMPSSTSDPTEEIGGMRPTSSLRGVREDTPHVSHGLHQTLDMFTYTSERHENDRNQRDLELAQRKSELAQKDLGLVHIKLELDQRNSELAHRKSELAHSKSELIHIKSELIHIKPELAQRDLELVHIKSELANSKLELAQRDLSLTQRDSELVCIKSELAQRNLELAQRDSELAHRESELAQKDLALAHIKSVLVQRNSELTQRDLALDRVTKMVHAHEAKLSTIGTSAVDPQITKNPQVISDAPKTVDANGRLAFSSNYNEWRENTPLTSYVRGGEEVSCEDVVESHSFQVGPEQRTDESEAAFLTAPISDPNTQANENSHLTSDGLNSVAQPSSSVASCQLDDDEYKSEHSTTPTSDVDTQANENSQLIPDALYSLPKSFLSVASFQAGVDELEPENSTILSSAVDNQPNDHSHLEPDASDSILQTSSPLVSLHQKAGEFDPEFSTSLSSDIGEFDPENSTILSSDVSNEAIENLQLTPNASDSVDQSFSSLVRPELDTDKLELELPTIPTLPANTQATEALQLVSNDPKVAVVNSVRSSIATSGQGISNNTIAQAGPSRSRYITGPPRSRYISASSRSTRESEAPKFESWGERFHGHYNAGSNSLKPHLPFTLSIPPNLPSYPDANSKYSFKLPNVKPPAKVATDMSAAGQSEALKKHRSLPSMVCTKSSVASVNLPIHGILKSTSGALNQPNSSSNHKAESKSIPFDMSENTLESSPSKLRHLKASVKDTIAEKGASAKAKFQPLKDVFRHSIPMSSLFPAKVQQTNDVDEEDPYATPILDVKNQDSKTPQLVSNGPETAVVHNMLSSITTCSQGTFQDTIGNTGPLRSRCLPASSSLIKNFEPPKTRSRRMKFFRSDDNTGSKPLNSHLPSTPGIPPNPPPYFDAVKKPSFNLAGVESPAKVPNNNSDGGQSELPKRTRFIELVARNNHSAIVDSMLLSASNSSECIESVLPTSPLRKFGEVPFEYGPTVSQPELIRHCWNMGPKDKGKGDSNDPFKLDPIHVIKSPVTPYDYVNFPSSTITPLKKGSRMLTEKKIFRKTRMRWK